MTETIITLQEVKKHRRKSSVWMVIHNDVYDVTSFLEEHPGGEDSLLEVAGKDGTQGFEDVGHSDDARELLKKYKIGTLPADQKSGFSKDCCKLKSAKSSRNSSKCSMCSTKSCPSLPKMDKPEKTWRTFDGPESLPVEPRFQKTAAPVPRAEPRVQSVVVPRERRRARRKKISPRPPPSSKLKWAILALAGAIVIGFALNKYLNK